MNAQRAVRRARAERQRRMNATSADPTRRGGSTGGGRQTCTLGEPNGALTLPARSYRTAGVQPVFSRRQEPRDQGDGQKGGLPDGSSARSSSIARVHLVPLRTRSARRCRWRLVEPTHRVGASRVSTDAAQPRVLHPWQLVANRPASPVAGTG